MRKGLTKQHSSSSGEPRAKALEVLTAPFLAGPRMPLGTRRRKTAPALEGARSQPSSAEKPKAKRRSSKSSTDAERLDAPRPASAASAPAGADEDEQEAEVDRIVDHLRTEDGQVKFRVRWKGHGATEDTWEPYRNLQNCQVALEQYRDVLRQRKARAQTAAAAPAAAAQNSAARIPANAAGGAASASAQSQSGGQLFTEVTVGAQFILGGSLVMVTKVSSTAATVALVRGKKLNMTVKKAKRAKRRKTMTATCTRHPHVLGSTRN